MASTICHASTSLMATASNSSSLPSSFRNWSSVVRWLTERLVFFFFSFMSSSSRLELSFAPERERQVFIGRFLALLDEAMKNDEFALLDAEQHARNPIARKV